MFDVCGTQRLGNQFHNASRRLAGGIGRRKTLPATMRRRNTAATGGNTDARITTFRIHTCHSLVGTNQWAIRRAAACWRLIVGLSARS
jgi:hypothetical protein